MTCVYYNIIADDGGHCWNIKHTGSGVRSVGLRRGENVNVYCDQDTDTGGWTVSLVT